jgi:hypothetical protein
MKKFVTTLLLSLVLLALPVFGDATESRSNPGATSAAVNSSAPIPAQRRRRWWRRHERRHWRRWHRRHDRDRDRRGEDRRRDRRG